MSWKDVGELHQMGFEIGNHSWTHADFSTPRNAARLAGELALVENELNARGRAQAGELRVLRKFVRAGSGGGAAQGGISFRASRRDARGALRATDRGRPLRPAKHHRLLIPTTGDAYPNWTFEHFLKVIAHAQEGRIVVLQFHGVPDTVHPWVHTPPENFERYMRHLKEQNFRVIALRDVEQYFSAAEPADPLLEDRSPRRKTPLPLPAEVQATQNDLAYWLPNMLRRAWLLGAGSVDGGGPSGGRDGAPVRVGRRPGRNAAGAALSRRPASSASGSWRARSIPCAAPKRVSSCPGIRRAMS